MEVMRPNCSTGKQIYPKQQALNHTYLRVIKRLAGTNHWENSPSLPQAASRLTLEQTAADTRFPVASQMQVVTGQLLNIITTPGQNWLLFPINIAGRKASLAQISRMFYGLEGTSTALFFLALN
jgi:hypothetical protein